jgi:hypothetical protein
MVLVASRCLLRKVIRCAAAQSKERILKSPHGLGKFYAMVFSQGVAKIKPSQQH